MKRGLMIFLSAVPLLPLFSAAAWDDPIPMEEARLPQETRYVPESGAYLQGMTLSPLLYILTEDAGDLRHVTIFRKDSGYCLLSCLSAPLSAVNGIKPSITAGMESLTLLYGEGLAYTFSLNCDGSWRLTGVTAASSCRRARYRLIEPGVGADRAIAGNGTSAPDKQAVSKGKSCNGTPVHITQDLGDWVKVTLASEEGYMMKQSLAFGMDMPSVQAAIPPLCILDLLAGKDVTAYLRPDAQSGAAGALTGRGAGRVEIAILAAVGGDWAYILCGNGLTGYLPVSDFGPQNG